MSAERVFLFLLAIAAIVAFIWLWRYMGENTCQFTSHCP
jgi:protein-S-isoprenylcysteine O-methyltransferase Ste14